MGKNRPRAPTALTMPAMPMEPSSRVYLGLGSNLGDRAASLWEAARRLAQLPGTHLLALSRLYETKPVGPVEQGWFLNAVASLDTTLPPRELLAEVKRIEREIGRVPSERWGPRLIDIDILLYGDQHIESDDLTIPHPELWRRRFTLVPLLDVLPHGPVSEQVNRALEELDGVSDDARLYVPLQTTLPFFD